MTQSEGGQAGMLPDAHLHKSSQLRSGKSCLSLLFLAMRHLNQTKTSQVCR